jgi:nucleotide-binding universal stress UspA family protein
MKKILLPTDFSDNALNAIQCALKMYKDVRCIFYISNAYALGSPNLINGLGSGTFGAQDKRRGQASEKGLQGLLEALNKDNRNTNHSFDTISRSGSVTSAILEIVLEKGIELIVMGTKGATGAKEIFMGSNTVKVIKSVDTCPIIAVPDGFEFTELKKLIFSTDFTRPFLKRELYELIELAKVWQPNIRVFHLTRDIPLSEEQVANKQVLKKYFKGLDYNFYNGVVDNDIVEAIQKFAAETKVDMMALMHYKKNLMEKISKTPVVKKVSFRTKVPLMVLPKLNIPV